MRKLVLILEYDGTNYVGMQRQKNGLSIQEVVEKALFTIYKKEVQITASGRTDAGVHAFFQPVHFYFLIDSISLQNLKIALNSLLPLDIRVKDVQEVEEDFHARYSAKKRSYLYKVCKFQTAFNYKHYSYFPYLKYNFLLIKPYLQKLIGEHDFTNFCKHNPNLKNNRCFIYDADILEIPSGWQINISANRFLHNMIRRIVGTCFVLLQEKANPEKICNFLQKEDIPVKYKFTAPPQGLYLYSVKY